MSHLLVVTRPSLVPGFQLAGVNAYGVEDIETSQELISSWLVAGEVGLLAIDDGLLEQLPDSFIRRLEFVLQIPLPGHPGRGSPGTGDLAAAAHCPDHPAGDRVPYHFQRRRGWGGGMK